MVQNVSPNSEDFISGNYYGARTLPRALRAFENENNADFCLYFDCTCRIFERAARAEVRARPKFFLIMRAKHFRCVLHLKRKNFIKYSNL